MQSGRLLARYDIRTPRLSDAAALADAYDRNRAHLSPYEPRRSEDFYTTEVQRESIRVSLDAQAHGRAAGWLILDDVGVAGRINLNNVVHGVLRSADLGYWIDRTATGQGLATAAVEFACNAAKELGLHRIGASTLIDNAPSQAVLHKCGFQQIGSAPSYLFIDGKWRDCDLFQRILHDEPVS
ncbi:MAG: GNAT family N-acetyltransferase [Nocardioidaceae bacterium]